MLGYFPKWIGTKSMQLFFFVLILMSVVWSQYAMSISYVLVSSVSIILFFYGSNVLTKKWSKYSVPYFTKKLFQVGLIVRLIWCLFIYFFNIEHYGSPIGSTEDTVWYIDMANEFVKSISNLNLTFFTSWFYEYNYGFDDIGYPIFLGLQYLITGNISEIVIPFIFKSILGAYSCVFIYKIAQRHFGESVGRISGILCMLYPHLIYWCGSMMKEAEMAFLCCWFAEQMDAVLMSKQLNWKALFKGVLLALSLYLFRSALAIVAFGVIFIALFMSDSKFISGTKKIAVTLIVGLVLVISIGGEMMQQFDVMYNKVAGEAQAENMEWRANREGGNEFAKYAGAAVFAPLIVTIPFPTMVEANPDQVVQMQMAGGNFIKNITSFFVMFVLFSLIINKEWRKHAFVLFFMLGYLAVLVVSGFAQSGRFHIPVMPLQMMFAAYGIAVFPQNKKHWFNYALLFEFVVCIAWNWFKLKGRGMI